MQKTYRAINFDRSAPTWPRFYFDLIEAAWCPECNAVFIRTMTACPKCCNRANIQELCSYFTDRQLVGIRPAAAPAKEKNVVKIRKAREALK